jgi:hypothetical protein
MKPYYDPGPHRVRITTQGFNQASTGTVQFWLRFIVLEQLEPFADNLEKFSRTMYLPITARTADRVMEDLHSLGFRGNAFEGVDPRQRGHFSFVDKEVELTCSHEHDQNNQPTERWLLRGVGRPVDDDKVSGLNQLLSKPKIVPKKSKTANGSSVSAPAISSDYISDDDLPPAN